MKNSSLIDDRILMDNPALEAIPGASTLHSFLGKDFESQGQNPFDKMLLIDKARINKNPLWTWL